MSANEKKMKDAMRIFEALSGVDEELLVRCEEDNNIGTVVPLEKKHSVWYYGNVMAACLCFVVVGVALLTMGPVIFGEKTNEALSPANFSAMQDAAVAEECAEVENADEGNVLTDEMDNRKNEGGASGLDTTTDGAGEGVQKQESQSQTSGTETETPLNHIKDAQGDSIDIEVCLQDSTELITLEEAKDVAVLGEYVPDTLPTGYTLESAGKKNNDATGEAESITLLWSKGMDDIHLTIAKVNPADIITVDIAETETYDVHQYEIPYAETVPENYRSIFNDPVFAEADFGPEMVKARMKVVSDQGDTDTPRGNFAVLYDSGIMVRFTGDGDAESIYEMFSSIK